MVRDGAEDAEKVRVVVLWDAAVPVHAFEESCLHRVNLTIAVDRDEHAEVLVDPATQETNKW